MLMWPHGPDSRVDDLDLRLLAGQVAARSSCASASCSWSWPVAVRTTLPSTSRLMHVLPAVVAAADQEAQELPLDGERGRGELALRAVAAEERVDQPLALEAADRLLAGQRAVGGRLAERLALDRPLAVVGALEIGQHDRRPRLASAARRRFGGAEHHRHVALAHTRLRRTPSSTSPLCRHTAFSSQPASVATSARPDVFFSVNCITVAGRAES